MKAAYLTVMVTLLTLICGFKSKAQTIKETDKGTCIIPWFDKLIEGKDNNFRVLVKNYNYTDLSVTISDGAFFSQYYDSSKSTYVYSINPNGLTKKITVYVRTFPKDSLCCSRTFKVIKDKHRVDKDLILLGDHGNKEMISVSETLFLNKIRLTKKGLFSFKPDENVIKSYAIAISPKEGSAYLEMVNGCRITKETRARFTHLKKGDLIVIANVQIEGKDGNKILPGITLTVK